ncbi:hypothetical protein NLG97_g9870 [Lecanicillium saksenae]|uniref:Uncharacterized protein n=1 Tax=Lecanicillium saksenae TaxID=468837 RepID=A0ACC1QI22_9HYPO|nr:hypothetical protein NLG97_g9870 [Lecanicillium saksenae]
MQHTSAIALAIAQFVFAANAQVDLDMDDVPNPCKTICKPIGTLSDRCDVDLRSDNDRDEHHLQNQCICTNKSFNVGKIAALCADCMHQSRKNKRDDDHADSDDLKDIDELLSVCGFSSTTYNSAATSEVASITVDVTRPTDISQLTTTIDRSHVGGGGAGGGNSATATSSGQSGQSTTGASASSSSGMATTTSPPAGSSQTSGSGGSQTSSSSSGAAGTTTSPNAGAAVTAQAVYAVGGLVAAAALLV